MTTITSLKLYINGKGVFITPTLDDLPQLLNREDVFAWIDEEV